MRQKYRAYALLAGANFETVIYMIAAWQISKWLNENYKTNFDWALVCFLLALLLIARSWYAIFRILIRDQRKESGDRNDADPKDKS